MRKSCSWTLLACLTLAAALASAGAARAADGWQVVYSRPGNNISAIAMRDSRNGIAIAGGGILRTDDGGVTWKEPSGQPPVGVGQVAFADPRRAWAVTLSGGIWRTEDGGATWSRQQSGTEAHMSALAVISADEAWAAAIGAGFSDVGPLQYPASVLLHTTDGGRVWQQVDVAGFGQFYDVAFAGARGWLVASRCRPGDSTAPPPPSPCDNTSVLLTSDDAGRSWAPLDPQPAVVPQSLRFFADGRGIGITAQCDGTNCRTRLFATVDGGRTWSRRDVGPDAVIAARFRTPADGWISVRKCDADCSVRFGRTSDGGLTWSFIDAPYAQAFSAFDVTDSTLIAAFGPTGIARYDIASGAWSEATSDARPPLTSIAFEDARVGFALTAAGVWRTADGGASWSPMGLQIVGQLNPLAATPGAVWAIGGCGAGCTAIYRNWLPVAPPPGISGTPALQAFGDRAWLRADTGYWRSDDGGATWRPLTPPGGNGTYTFIDRDHGYANICGGPGCARAFAVTRDGGETSETRPLPARATAVAFVSADVGWATAFDASDPTGGCPCTNRLYRTTDGGRSWQLLQSGADSFYQLTFVDASRGWAVRNPGNRSPGELAATSDGGRTWQRDTDAELGTLSLTAGRLCMLGGFSSTPFEPGRTVISCRSTQPARALLPPDTGAGSWWSGIRTPWVAAITLAGAALVLVGARRGIRRRSP